LAQQLLQRLRGHRAAPDHGFVLRHQETDGHDLHAKVFHRLHGLAVGAFGPAFDTHHHRLARAVDVGVKQADGGTFGGQRQRQVGRRGALAHAALARRHGNDVLHLGQQRHAALRRVGDDAHRDVGRDVVHARNAFGSGDQCAAKGRNLALRRVAQLDVERHVAAGDLQVLQGFGRDKVGAGVRVDDGLEGLQQLFGRGHSGIFRT